MTLSHRFRAGLLWAAVALLTVLAWRAGARFPWQQMYETLVRANPGLLAWAALISLLALTAKGWAWHLLLNPVARHRFWIAQEANLVGAAVNSISVAVIGEAARVRLLANREGVPYTVGVTSVVWTRAVEGVGLALFILAGGATLPLPALVRGAELGAAVVLAILGIVLWSRGRAEWPAWVPGPIAKAVDLLASIGSWRRLAWPVALAVANWLGQWATYHLTLAATGIPITAAGSFTALLASNIGGALRLTPANVGITQASIAVGLLPFGVPPADAVAASIVLQALQVLPVLALALGVVGWKGFGQLRARAAEEA